MLIGRRVDLPQDYSFFLLGVRGSGKSTLLRQQFVAQQALVINLLDPLEEMRFLKNPAELRQLVLSLDPSVEWVVLDEIQKVPKLLDVVHLLLETDQSPKKFILTGSSAKKLRAAGVNLLAGRAFTYYLFPFSYLELGDAFDLDTALAFGLLPKLFSFTSTVNKIKFLQSYVANYLTEEIKAEQLVKNLEYFRRFLEVAAQSNGKILSFLNIARDVGVRDKTVKQHFYLLEDTLMGFFLEPFHHSFRKRLRAAPKFYFIDVGIARALSATLGVMPAPGTSYYGELFEQFIVTECFKLKHYYQLEYRFSYLLTAGDAEIDLIIERPGLCPLFIEIKSKGDVNAQDIATLSALSQDFGDCEAICLSQDPRRKLIGNVTVYPWKEGLRYIFQVQD